MVVRDYEPGDAKALMELLHATVHSVCTSDYTPEQLAAWSPESGQQVKAWAARFAVKKPFVAMMECGPVGFIELESDGHIDCLYVHRDLQKKGIGTRLLEHAMVEARSRSIHRLHANVSVTAIGFFKKHGFSVVRTQEVERNGQRLKNFAMERVSAADTEQLIPIDPW